MSRRGVLGQRIREKTGCLLALPDRGKDLPQQGIVRIPGTNPSQIPTRHEHGKLTRGGLSLRRTVGRKVQKVPQLVQISNGIGQDRSPIERLAGFTGADM